MKFLKSSRLLKSREFYRVYKAKNRFRSKFFYIDYCFAQKARLGISVKKSFGKAFLRNRFKRLIREAFRLEMEIFPAVEINVMPKEEAKKASLADFQHILRQFKKTLCKQKNEKQITCRKS